MYKSWVEISTKALLNNLAQYQKLVGNEVAVMPIVKSNAYGHGMVAVAKLLAGKVKWLGLVSSGEALELRRQGLKNKLFVLSYFDQNELDTAIKKNISLPLYSLEDAKAIDGAAKKAKSIARVHLKIDTGASRVGVLSSEAGVFFRKIKQFENLKIDGIYSHFADSEENKAYTENQVKQFKHVLDKAIIMGIEPDWIHIGCSAGAVTANESRFNLVRLGISLYGLLPSPTVLKAAKRQLPSFKLEAALSWKTKILQVKKIAKGTKVGYGCTYEAKKDLTMAVIGVGYWEGFDRKLSNSGEVEVRGILCPVIGRVCMNISMIDVSKIKNPKVGETVALIGTKATADKMAKQLQTINYEVVTRINPQLKRIYI